MSAEKVASSSHEPPAPQWRREHERHQANWPGTCTHRGLSWAVVVFDVSAGGAGLDRDLPVDKDETVTLEMEGVGTYVCRLAWKFQSRCGVQFLRRADELSDEAITGLATSLLDIG